MRIAITQLCVSAMPLGPGTPTTGGGKVLKRHPAKAAARTTPHPGQGEVLNRKPAAAAPEAAARDTPHPGQGETLSRKAAAGTRVLYTTDPAADQHRYTIVSDAEFEELTTKDPGLYAYAKNGFMYAEASGADVSA